MSAQITTTPGDEFAVRGRRAWKEYQRSHDITGLVGHVAAIEPYSGRTWIGQDALEAIDAMNEDGVDAPAWLVRIGFDYLDVKGRR
jgi:hypothetical protein